MSAVSERSRRATAGRRMTHLVGKAADDDAAFWNHDTWAEDIEGENDSYNASDEDSDAKKDAFDSDFNDSETDHEDEEVAAGEEEERRLQREEKLARRNKAMDAARAGRELIQKKKGKIKGNRIFGDGANAGLVLNFPPTGLTAMPLKQPPAPPRPIAAAVAPIAPLKKLSSKQTLASTRSRRGKKHLRNSTQESSKTSEAISTAKVATARTGKGTKRAKLQRFTQEQLLLEAATETEQDNRRWLLGRKRLHQEAEATRTAATKANQQQSQHLLRRFVSKKGFFNTINFASMEHVPKIITKQHEDTKEPRKETTICVVTGKQARYMDPKTKVGYHDLTAFKELRRRLESGERLDQRPKKVAVAPKKPPPSDTSSKISTTPTQVVTNKPMSSETKNVADTTSPSSDLSMTTRRGGKRVNTKVDNDAPVTGKARTLKRSEAKVKEATLPKQASDKPAALHAPSTSVSKGPVETVVGAKSVTSLNKSTTKHARVSDTKESFPSKATRSAGKPIEGAPSTKASATSVADSKTAKNGNKGDSHPKTTTSAASKERHLVNSNKLSTTDSKAKVTPSVVVSNKPQPNKVQQKPVPTKKALPTKSIPAKKLAPEKSLPAKKPVPEKQSLPEKKLTVRSTTDIESAPAEKDIATTPAAGQAEKSSKPSVVSSSRRRVAAESTPSEIIADSGTPADPPVSAQNLVSSALAAYMKLQQHTTDEDK